MVREKAEGPGIRSPADCEAGLTDCEENANEARIFSTDCEENTNEGRIF